MKFSIKKNRALNIESTLKQSRFQEKVFAEQIELLYNNLFISVPSGFLCATIIFIALYRIPHTNLLLYWFMAMIFISVLRIGLSGFYAQAQRSTKLAYYWFLLTTTLAGAVWGFAGAALMPENNQVEQMIVIIVIAGVTAGGVQSLQASLLACLIYINLLIIPLLSWIFLKNETAHTILGISVLLYLLFTIVIALRGYKFLKQTLRLKYENIDLAENVSTSNKQLKQMNQDLLEKEDNLRLIHDNAPIGMAIVSLDGSWINVNNKLCDIVGYSKEELENLTIQDVTYKEDLEIDVDSRAKLLSGKLQSYQIEKRYVNKNDKLIWIITNVSLVRGKEDKPLYYISQVQDINDRKQNEAIISGLSSMNGMLQLCHESTEAYPIICHTANEIFNGISGGLAIFNKLMNKQERVGCWGDNPLLSPLFKSDDCWAFRSGNIYIVNDPNKDVVCRHFDTPPSGGYICLPLIVQSQMLGMLNFTAPKGQTITHYQQQVIENFREVIKLSLANIQLNEALSEQAVRDPLTGLLNRRYLYEYLPQMLQNAIKTKHAFCVCMLDIDFFKHINDQHGHDAGDEVLKYIGTLLKNNTRESDIACRFGGEEFVIVLLGSDLNHAKSQMEHIRTEVKSAQIYSQNHLLPPITISIGIAEAPQHGDSINEILRVADAALYAAKEAGRDRVVNGV